MTKKLVDSELLAHARRTHVQISTDSGCWVWVGGRTVDGYGCISVKRKTKLAHRYFYEQMVGAIPPGLTLDHLCRNPACVNPSHLEPVSSRVNTLRGTSPPAINSTKTHCPKGHHYSVENTRIDILGKRHCRACERARWHTRKGKK